MAAQDNYSEFENLALTRRGVIGYSALDANHAGYQYDNISAQRLGRAETPGSILRDVSRPLSGQLFPRGLGETGV